MVYCTGRVNVQYTTYNLQCRNPVAGEFSDYVGFTLYGLIQSLNIGALAPQSQSFGSILFLT